MYGRAAIEPRGISSLRAVDVTSAAHVGTRFGFIPSSGCLPVTAAAPDRAQPARPSVGDRASAASSTVRYEGSPPRER
jgi:hypothetical protein